MKALILAAGLGSRLQHLTKNQPKCMVSVNNEKLIDRLIRTLISNNILTIGGSGSAPTVSNQVLMF